MQKEKEPFPEDDIPENESSKEEEKIEEKKRRKERRKRGCWQPGTGTAGNRNRDCNTRYIVVCPG